MSSWFGWEGYRLSCRERPEGGLRGHPAPPCTHHQSLPRGQALIQVGTEHQHPPAPAPVGQWSRSSGSASRPSWRGLCASSPSSRLSTAVLTVPGHPSVWMRAQDHPWEVPREVGGSWVGREEGRGEQVGASVSHLDHNGSLLFCLSQDTLNVSVH